jgi:hypothetical protein
MAKHRPGAMDGDVPMRQGWQSIGVSRQKSSAIMIYVSVHEYKRQEDRVVMQKENDNV